MVFRYALRVSGFHCCRANACTICSVVTSSGPDGMSSAARCTILYRRLLIVCADRPAALRVSVHPSMLLRHGTGALILFLMIHHEHPDLHAAKLSLDKLRSPMDLNLGPLVYPEVQGSNPCPATSEKARDYLIPSLFSYSNIRLHTVNLDKFWTNPPSSTNMNQQIHEPSRIAWYRFQSSGEASTRGPGPSLTLRIGSIR